MKYTYALFWLFKFLLCTVSLSYGQKGIVGSGGEVSGTDFFVSYSIGQMDYITVSTPTGFITEGLQQNYKTNSSLPISLLSFTAIENQDVVDVKWETIVEINNNYFTVERSTDSKSFEEIAQIKGAGNSNTILKYLCIDKKPIIGQSYYRLKQTDFSGRFKYSAIAAVYFSSDNFDVSIYPNPFKESTSLYIKGYDFSEITYQLLDINGKLLMQHNVEGSETKLSTHDLPNGVYFINVLRQNISIKRELIIKNEKR